MENISIIDFFNWAFSLILIVVGILNLVLVHPVPGLVYLLLLGIYLQPINSFIQSKWGFKIPILVKFILAIAIIMFTLGVSDLGDMIDKL